MKHHKGGEFYGMRRAPGVPPRWTATAYYATADGMIDVQHDIEELDMLHDLIEAGPDWHTLDRIEIRRNE